MGRCGNAARSRCAPESSCASGSDRSRRTTSHRPSRARSSAAEIRSTQTRVVAPGRACASASRTSSASPGLSSTSRTRSSSVAVGRSRSVSRPAPAGSRPADPGCRDATFAGIGPAFASQSSGGVPADQERVGPMARAVECPEKRETLARAHSTPQLDPGIGAALPAAAGRSAAARWSSQPCRRPAEWIGPSAAPRHEPPACPHEGWPPACLLCRILRHRQNARFSPEDEAACASPR
jgi:hypothetical protein